MRRNAWRSVATVLIGTLVTLAPVLSATSASAAAPGYPPTVCASLQVNTTTPNVGEAVTVTGVNFLPNADVDLKLKPTPDNTTASDTVYDLKTVTSDASGGFTTSVVMPAATTSQGNFLIFATSGAPNDSSCPADPATEISLAAAGDNGANNPDGTTNTNGNGAPGSTAFTGVNVLILVLIAAGLITVGAVITRRGKATSVSR